MLYSLPARAGRRWSGIHPECNCCCRCKARIWSVESQGTYCLERVGGVQLVRPTVPQALQLDPRPEPAVERIPRFNGKAD